MGGGPSGLAAAYELTRTGMPVVLLEAQEQVGGLSRTVNRNGLRYDVGPHRFFTKNKEVLKLWQTILADELITVNRLTRILYRDKLFNYPLAIGNTLAGLGALESMRIMGSYVKAQAHRLLGDTPVNNFEDWVTSQFGHRLFEIFFKTYSEKVWGIPCQQISAEWAGQRIKGLTLYSAIMNALYKNSKSRPKTLVEQFLYPLLGAGYFYERQAAAITARGGQVLTGHRCVALRHENGQVRAVVAQDSQGRNCEIEAQAVISSAPITDMVKALTPSAPPEILGHVEKLRYRGHIGVNLEIDGSLFPDQWIYVHAKELQMGRIADYRNFSRYMTDSPDRGAVTVEYFTFPQEGLWRASDQELLALAKRELNQCRQFSSAHITGGFVVRHPQAYPLIELGYERSLNPIKSYLQGFQGLQVIGRGGMFRYNNQDHAIATGLLAARNITGCRYDIWKVNIEAEYHEDGEWHEPNATPDGDQNYT